METIAFAEARRRLSEIIDRVSDEPIVITRYGKQTAALISIDNFRKANGFCAALARWRQTNDDLFLESAFENVRQNDDARAFEWR
jgi:prevent-host-death family protein